MTLELKAMGHEESGAHANKLPEHCQLPLDLPEVVHAPTDPAVRVDDADLAHGGGRMKPGRRHESKWDREAGRRNVISPTWLPKRENIMA